MSLVELVFQSVVVTDGVGRIVVKPIFAQSRDRGMTPTPVSLSRTRNAHNPMLFLDFRKFAKAALLLMLASGSGCTGTPTSEGSLNLPSFGAPKQWEPEVSETPEPTDEDPS